VPILPGFVVTCESQSAPRREKVHVALQNNFLREYKCIRRRLEITRYANVMFAHVLEMISPQASKSSRTSLCAPERQSHRRGEDRSN